MLDVLAGNRQVVLLGDPGSGKTTFTRRLAASLAAVALKNVDGEEVRWAAQVGAHFEHWLLPVRVVLSTWAQHLPTNASGTANDLVSECVRLLAEPAKLDGARQLEDFVQRITSEKATALLLLDGLDEVSDVHKRGVLLNSIRDFCKDYPHVPLLVTCRVRPYTEGKDYKLPLAAFELAPLHPQNIRSFVERWHTELVWAGRYTQSGAAVAQTNLLASLGNPNRAELREMAETPLLLTMMARVNYKRGLPNSRAQLYEEYVDQLLYEWERTKLDEKGKPTRLDLLLQEGGVSPSSLDRKLNELAYTVHGQGGSRDTLDIARNDMRNALEAIHPGSDDEKAAWAVRLLRLIDDRSGLIYAVVQEETYRFSHRTFQEFLAARWMAKSDSYLSKFRDKLDQAQWREAIFLALGHQIWEGYYDKALAVLHNLMPQQPHTETDWRRVLLLSEAYVRLLGPQRAGEAEQNVMADQVIRTIPKRLTAAMQNRNLPPHQRLDAGLFLADLHILPPDLDKLVPIAAADTLGYNFRMGKYPVTNAQFRRFVEDGGYAEDKPWWTEEAVKDIEQFSRNDGWRKGPRFWGDPCFDRDTQPVVGVSWYEAVAYCEWLTAQLRAQGKLGQNEEVRLPTKEEWMRAARNTHGGEYPWNGDFDSALANTEESSLEQTTPVHMYRDGKSAEGVWDLVGNVWEWSNDDYNNWGKAARGGGYYNDADGVRSSACDGVFPSNGYVDLGFRLVVVPIPYG